MPNSIDLTSVETEQMNDLITAAAAHGGFINGQDVANIAAILLRLASSVAREQLPSAKAEPVDPSDEGSGTEQLLPPKAEPGSTGKQTSGGPTKQTSGGSSKLKGAAAAAAASAK